MPTTIACLPFRYSFCQLILSLLLAKQTPRPPRDRRSTRSTYSSGGGCRQVADIPPDRSVGCSERSEGGYEWRSEEARSETRERGMGAHDLAAYSPNLLYGIRERLGFNSPPSDRRLHSAPAGSFATVLVIRTGDAHGIREYRAALVSVGCRTHGESDGLAGL